MDIGKIIYMLRKEENLTQEKLAKQVGIAQTNISDWENNVSRPEYENLVKLSKIFAVSTDYLLGLEDESGSKVYEENFEYEDGTHKIKHSKR